MLHDCFVLVLITAAKCSTLATLAIAALILALNCSKFCPFRSCTALCLLAQYDLQDQQQHDNLSTGTDDGHSVSHIGEMCQRVL
jgi:uncharacterized membrane protein